MRRGTGWAMPTLLVVGLVSGCGAPSRHSAAPGTLPVVAGVPPVAFLAEQIGREHVRVETLVRPGQDPHTFEPTPQQITALGHAVLFLGIDLPFETVIVEKVRQGNERLRMVDLSRGISKRAWNAACSEGEGEHEHESGHGTPDPHVWLALPLLKTLAENTAAALCEADAAHQDDYRKNLHELVERIDRQHERIRRSLEPFRGRSFYVFHPGFGYFADAYGLKEQAVEVGGQAPTAQRLREIVATAQRERVTTVFVQPQYAPQSARAVAEAIGARIVTINGLDKDVLADIDDIAAKIEESFNQEDRKK